MFMKSSGIVWLWNLVSESQHDVKWEDVALSFCSGVAFSTLGARRASSQRPCITKTGQSSKDYFMVAGFTFQSRMVGNTQEALTAGINHAHTFKHTHSVLNLDRGKKLCSVPATWSCSKHSRNRSAWFTLISPVMRLQLFQSAAVTWVPLSYIKYLKMKWHC